MPRLERCLSPVELEQFLLGYANDNQAATVEAQLPESDANTVHSLDTLERRQTAALLGRERDRYVVGYGNAGKIAIVRGRRTVSAGEDRTVRLWQLPLP